MEICGDENAIVLERGGWFRLEHFRNESFRWVGNDARLTVATLRPAAYKLCFLIEPGPGVGLKPFELKVLESDGTPVGSVKVSGKETVSVPMPRGEPRTYRLVLHIDGGGAKALRDERILNFRIFEVKLLAEKSDIVPVDRGLKVGRGWYPLETFNDETFRWAGEEVSLDVLDPAAATPTTLHIEPGPGVDHKPFKLAVLDQAGMSLGEIEVAGRQFVSLPAFPAFTSGPNRYRLRVSGGGKTTRDDARTMNFRAFSSDQI